MTLYQCEEFLESKFGEKCNFDVVDAVNKLERWFEMYTRFPEAL
jgi:hypothetical protein